MSKDKAEGNSDSVANKVQFLLSSITDNSQIAIAVAVGLFGILTIFVGIDQVIGTHKGLYTDWDNLELWEKGAKLFLSLAYLGLLILGGGSIMFHRINTKTLERYFIKEYRSYLDDLEVTIRTSKVFWIAKLLLRNLLKGKEISDNGTWFILIVYVALSVLLGFYCSSLNPTNSHNLHRHYHRQIHVGQTPVPKISFEKCQDNSSSVEVVVCRHQDTMNHNHPAVPPPAVPPVVLFQSSKILLL